MPYEHEIDPDGIIDAAIELANAAIEAWRDEPPTQAPGKAGGDCLRSAVDNLLDEVRGLRGGCVELDGICMAIDGNSGWGYAYALVPMRLCSAKTRLAIPGVPVSYFTPEQAEEFQKPDGFEVINGVVVEKSERLAAAEEHGLIWLDLETFKREEAEREAAREAERLAEKARQDAEREARRNWMNDQERAALYAYAAKHGRLWKRKLRHAWETGDWSTASDPGILQRLRNVRYFGPAGLEKFKVRKLVPA